MQNYSQTHSHTTGLMSVSFLQLKDGFPETILF
jgi:hypothetical protein